MAQAENNKNAFLLTQLNLKTVSTVPFDDYKIRGILGIN
jgi:hypothetical protein